MTLLFAEYYCIFYLFLYIHNVQHTRVNWRVYKLLLYQTEENFFIDADEDYIRVVLYHYYYYMHDVVIATAATAAAAVVFNEIDFTPLKLSITTSEKKRYKCRRRNYI